VVLGWLTFAVLTLFVLVQVRAPFFDEVYHLSHAMKLATSTSLKAWLLSDDGSAVGPLYGFMYGGPLRVGDWPAPWLRLPNLIGLLFVVKVLAAIARGNIAVGLSLMAVPMTWVAGGMALTEVPAMVFLAVALLAAERLRNNANDSLSVRWLAVLALGIGLAVATRQTSLVVIPALAVLAGRSALDYILLALVFALALLPMAVVFAIWGGLIPPAQQGLGGGFKPVHALYGSAYLGLAACLIAPAWWWRQRTLAIIGAILTTVIVLGTNTAPMGMMSSALRAFGNRQFASTIERGAGYAALAVGGAMAALLLRAAVSRSDRRQAALAFAVLAVASSCAAVTRQFSSRYVLLGMPFLVTMLAPEMEFGRSAWIRLGLGSTIGLLVLRSFYLFA
jgi:hypothetical protein